MPLKSHKEKNNKVLKKMEKDKSDKSILEQIFSDVSKASASKQLILGSSSGLITGLICTKVGKAVAISVGGGIIILQLANQYGYINVNWDKVNKNIDKIADKVEEKVTGEGPSWVDKMERYVDRKLDKAEDVIKKQGAKARRWYEDDNGDSLIKVKESYIFFTSFFAGVCIGMAIS